MVAATEQATKNGATHGTGEVNTICSFCGVGCGLTVKLEDGVIQKVVGYKDAPSSKGEACIKGREGWRYMYSEKRLTKPLIRKDGELVEASWEEALDLIGSRMSQIRDESGGEAFGVFSSSRSTNELNYLASKFVRSVLGTNSIDSCNRA
ncbi:Molybdopterin oxidoreductase Fe4S4 domain [Rubrobacter radiotolerans]|nr:Molybdopterin oxidoreductase Fe4S4 domain [Rubrobacter radiotolerans]